MTDRPILFSGPMIRALLGRRKTQTRRVLKPQPEPRDFRNTSPEAAKWFHDPVRGGMWIADGVAVGPFKSPAPGDRLWVREAWTNLADDPLSDLAMSGRTGIAYYADDADECCIPPRWRPSIHMPRRASRLTLIVTDVRVQRLQEISELDAVAEGCRPFFDHGNPREYVGPNGTVHQMAPLLGPLDDFRRLWNSLNAERGYGWEVNPWVCALTFTVHRTNIDEMEAA